MQTDILFIVLISVFVVFLSPQQRKILVNLCLHWMLRVLNLVVMFILGLWITVQLIDSDYVNILPDDDTEQSSDDDRSDDSDEEEDVEDATEEERPAPPKKEEDKNKLPEEKKNNISKEENQPQLS